MRHHYAPTMSIDISPFSTCAYSLPQVHTYLASCGRTLEGKPQEHKDDFNPDGTPGGPRKCPMVGNDFSAVQPHCDKSNRWRQRILAIEERVLTKSFPIRFTSTGVGIMFVNVWSGFDYFVLRHSGQMYFHGCMKALCAEGLRADLDSANGPRPGPNPFGAARNPGPSPPHESHTLCSLTTIVGWTGARAPRCGVCNTQCTTVCNQCSTATLVCPVHAASISYKGHVSHHPCMLTHRRDPEGTKRRAASLSKSIGAHQKWRKRKAAAQGQDSDEYDDDDQDPA